MEIINYAEMLDNANLIKALANKTIECSKDYTDSRKDDIVDQMMEYLALTVQDVLASGIDLDRTFCEQANRGQGISFARFGDDGTGARLQFWYNSGSNGAYIRAYFNEEGYWYSAKEISDSGLNSLIDGWPSMKQSWNTAITNGINAANRNLNHRVTEQLALHEAVKNFKI